MSSETVATIKFQSGTKFVVQKDGQNFRSFFDGGTHPNGDDYMSHETVKAALQYLVELVDDYGIEV